MALVLTLVVISVAAGIFAAIMYFSLTGTEIAASQKKYQSSKEASLGAIDVLTKNILPSAVSGANLSAIVSTLGLSASVLPSIQANAAKDACFQAKLSSLTSSWPAGCDSGPDATINSDIVFNLKSTSGSTRPYVVNLKIIDTVSGNSDKSGTILDTGSGVVDDASSLIRIQHFPFLYTIMSDARLQNSTAERANIEVLYAY